MVDRYSYTTAGLTKLADELETDIGVHEHSQMLLSKHRLRELVAALRDARDWLEAITESSGPLDGTSVGPWKECVYKHPDAPSLPSIIEQHGLCVAYHFPSKKWHAQDCRYNSMTEGATLDEAVQALLPKLVRCQRCQLTTTRAIHDYYCKAEDCEVRLGATTWSKS